MQAFERKRSYGRVVELVDSLDSGSSVHCGRAGSSPASPTKEIRRLLSTDFLIKSIRRSDRLAGKFSDAILATISYPYPAADKAL